METGANLKFWERVNVRLIEWVHRNAGGRAICNWFLRHLTAQVIGFFFEGLVRAHGVKHIEAISRESRILFCANHRSFLDNFAIGCLALPHLPSHWRLLFPIRTEGFYDHPFGVLINLLLSSLHMYPPIVRGSRGVRWGKVVVQILCSELSRGSLAVFIHPEGGRNKSQDPYNLRAARPGLGKLIFETETKVIPVFLQGFPKTFTAFMRARFFRSRPAEPLVHVVFGEPLNFEAAFKNQASPRTFHQIASAVNLAIANLGEEEREIRRERERDAGEAAAPPQ